MAETIIAAVGTAVLEGLIGLVSGFVINMVGGLISDLIEGQDHTLDHLSDAWGQVLEDVEQLASNAVDSMMTVAASSINAGADALKGVLDVTDAQTDLMESLQYGAEHYYDNLLEDMRQERIVASQTGAALTDFAFRLMSEHSDMLQLAGETFYSSLEAGIVEERFGTTNYAAAMLGNVQKWLAADLMMVENLSEREAEAAALMVIEIAKEDARFVEEWFLETVAKPIAYGSNIEWALRQVSQIDPETYKEQLLGAVRASWEVYQEVLAKGYTPPE